MANLNFPAELTDRIIDFLHSDEHALASCSLVCKSWVPASRYHFFDEITIATVAKARAFFELFESTIAKGDIDENGRRRGIGFIDYVRRVSWSVTKPGCLTDYTIQIIASFPSLSEFCFVSHSPSVCPSLGPLKNIKKLMVLGCFQNAVSCVAIAIANNPNLECLDVSSEGMRDVPAMPQFHDLLVDIPPDSLSLRLQHLGVTGFDVHLDRRVLPHLRSLTSLEILSNSTWHIMDSAEFWRTLKSERIQLSRLKTSAMNDELLEFLSSLKGLTALRLGRFTLNDEEDSNRLAKIFFQVVLPRHANTLETLDINPLYEGDWCYGKHNAIFFMNCTNIKELGTSVYWPRGLDFSDGTPVDFLLNSTSEFPHSLRLHNSYGPSHRHTTFGDYFVYYEEALKAIHDAIDRFIPQIGGGRSPVSEIHTSQKKFKWREGKYHEVTDS